MKFKVSAGTELPFMDIKGRSSLGLGKNNSKSDWLMDLPYCISIFIAALLDLELLDKLFKDFKSTDTKVLSNWNINLKPYFRVFHDSN